MTPALSYSVSKSFAEELRQSGTPCSADKDWDEVRQQQHQQQHHVHASLSRHCHTSSNITVVIYLPPAPTLASRQFSFDDVRATVGERISVILFVKICLRVRILQLHVIHRLQYIARHTSHVSHHIPSTTYPSCVSILHRLHSHVACATCTA
jgi:hypothetical protein